MGQLYASTLSVLGYKPMMAELLLPSAEFASSPFHAKLFVISALMSLRGVVTVEIPVFRCLNAEQRRPPELAPAASRIS